MRQRASVSHLIQDSISAADRYNTPHRAQLMPQQFSAMYLPPKIVSAQEPTDGTTKSETFHSFSPALFLNFYFHPKLIVRFSQ